MKCRLCLQDKPLLRKSHIIPSFMYKELFDDKHRMAKIHLPTFKGNPIQSGEHEADLLCSSCDNVLLGSNLEAYASEVLYGGSKTKDVVLKNEINQHGVTYSYCKGIDYKKFKLFFIVAYLADEYI